MIHVKIPFFLLFVLVACVLAWNGERQGQGNGMMNGFNRRGSGNGGMRGGEQGFGEMQGRNSRQSFGGQEGKKYRSNLYNDDDVYGYDATYPNGEAAYINYKSKDARARRGPEFARTSRAYSRQGAGGERGNNGGQMSEYMAGGRGGGMCNKSKGNPTD